MGCFNKIGFYSNLPITIDNKIVYFICIKYNNVLEDNAPIAPYGKLSPFCLPIFGDYNDYGSITNVIKDNNVEYIESLLHLTIEEVIEAIEEFSGCCLNNIDQSLNHAEDKKMNNYITILNTIKKNNILQTKNFDNNFSLTSTMELYDVYSFLIHEYNNDKSHEILNSMTDIIIKNELHCINIFQRHVFIDYHQYLLDNYKSLDQTERESILKKINAINDLNKLLGIYSSYNCFNCYSLGTLMIYGINDFNILANIDLINNFSNFCLCLFTNCRQFDSSSYGNQDILSQCDMLIKEHEEFVKILKEKKKEFQ